MSNRELPPRAPNPRPKPQPKDHFWESVAAYIVIIACFAAFLFTCMEVWH